MREEFLKQLNAQILLAKTSEDKALEHEKQYSSTQELLQAQTLRAEIAEKSATASEQRENAIQEELKQVRT